MSGKSDSSVIADISPESLQRAHVWLKEKWGLGPRQCPSCRETDEWEVQKKYSTTVVMDGKGDLQLGTSFPHIAVVCMNCGYTEHYNAVVMNLLQRPTSEGGENV